MFIIRPLARQLGTATGLASILPVSSAVGSENSALNVGGERVLLRSILVGGLQSRRGLQTTRPSLDADDDNSGNSGNGTEDEKKMQKTSKQIEFPFDTNTAPKRLPNHQFFLDRHKMERRKSLIYMSQEEKEGTHGSDSLLSLNTNEIDQYLPTAQTMKQLFDGVPYEELPIVWVHARPNNTLVHCVDHTGKHIVYTSSRLEGFKNAKKKSPVAGQATGAGAGIKMRRRGVLTVRVVVKGLGVGRMSSVKGLVSSGINVVSITDFTPLPELGPRPRKVRRV